MSWNARSPQFVPGDFEFRRHNPSPHSCSTSTCARTRKPALLHFSKTSGCGSSYHSFTCGVRSVLVRGVGETTSSRLGSLGKALAPINPIGSCPKARSLRLALALRQCSIRRRQRCLRHRSWWCYWPASERHLSASYAPADAVATMPVDEPALQSLGASESPGLGEATQDHQLPDSLGHCLVPLIVEVAHKWLTLRRFGRYSDGRWFGCESRMCCILKH